jgi:pyruvate/2-oxoglutarate/acetoin dehydrogenase E1 component/TPP-dependent pyruvate/acetoin dehydrogenase alpha subunit
MTSENTMSPRERLTFQFTRESVVRDYRIAYQSRQASLLGRKEVLTGKAKFGIFGDGKEVAQVALARAFRKGDFRSGYYRDQTLMFALGLLRIDEFFAQLYADSDAERDPSSGGRQMNSHFASRLLTEDGQWRKLTDSFNSAADLSPTGAQMPRLVGLAFASRLYRNLEGLEHLSGFSKNGDEIAFGTIGDASCAEGVFWEAVNAAGALRAPMLLSIWDDGYGISVPTEFHITKGHLSSILRGFQRAPGDDEGFDLYTVKGWDYPALCETYLNAAEVVRREHVPAIVHVAELTQPQGHSTSGSHERYKSQERLEWEREHDCLTRMRQWMVEEKIAEHEELSRLEEEDRQLVQELQRRAWDACRRPVEDEKRLLVSLLSDLAEGSAHEARMEKVLQRLGRVANPHRRDLLAAAQESLIHTRSEKSAARERLIDWRDETVEAGTQRYGSFLHSDSQASALAVQVVEARFSENSPLVNGFEVLNRCFDEALGRYPNLVAFGEDVGQLGDVNQGFMGLQEKYGELRVSDTGIREATILGQAIGMALRGLRPLAEIQYLDYVLYALQIMSDDLATLHWRTRGGQKAPVIVRTRGHRLEGIWHSGSPISGILNLVRGMHVLVPRDMVQAAGMFNTLLRSDDPALLIEVLNGYRLKERLPDNVGEFTIPFGVPEVLREGRDVTLVTYGACCRLALEAAELLTEVGIDLEVIDVQTLDPFDLQGRIKASLEKTNRILFLDEDVPGGATAYMMQQVLDAQGGFEWLDAPPRTLSAKAHRPAYGSDGDYFSKPNREEIFSAVYELMHHSDPRKFPAFDT